MNYHFNALEILTEQFRALPGIGSRNAQRLAFYLLCQPENRSVEFAEALLQARKSVCLCQRCQNLTDASLCPICADAGRDSSVICVVQTPAHLMAIEKTKSFHGVYHVLHGALSPMDRIGPADLKINELFDRLTQGGVKEVILATDPTVEGDATAIYLCKHLKTYDVKISRIAFGLPVGGDLEYADEMTLANALENRREFV